MRTIVCLAVLCQVSAASGVEPSSVEMVEHVKVAKEACGGNPSFNCLAELKKVCHAHLTFRCYYSRKDRLDAVRQVGFPDPRARELDE